MCAAAKRMPVWSTPPDAREAGDSVRVAATIDEALHEPIVYVGVVLTSGQTEPARRFLDFCQSPAGRGIFARRGFTPAATQPNDSAAAGASTQPGGAAR